MADLADAEHRNLLDLVDQVTEPRWTPSGRGGARRAHRRGVPAPVRRGAVPAARPPAPRCPTRAERVDREIEADAALLAALKALPGRTTRRWPTWPRGSAGTSTGSPRWSPPLREVATDAELIRLGNRWEIAEEAAPTRPHPGTPATPPWNRIVEPAVGVVDKVRDAVTAAADVPGGPAEPAAR